VEYTVVYKNMDDLKGKLVEIKKLNKGSYDYVLARAESNSISDAIEVTGYSRDWYYKAHSKEEREVLEQLAEELHYAKLTKALVIVEEASAAAAKVMVMEMANKHADIRLRAAKDILDRAGIKKPEQHEVVHGVRDDMLRSFDDMLEKIYGNRNKDTEPAE
jgi:hypothetical protein